MVIGFCGIFIIMGENAEKGGIPGKGKTWL